MTILLTAFHIIVDVLIGLGILYFLGNNKPGMLIVTLSLALGFLVEGLFAGILNYLGVSVLISFISFAVVSIGFFSCLFLRSKGQVLPSRPEMRMPTSWIEWISIVVIAEALIWTAFNIYKMPLYFDDALNHWSGRAKAILFDVNWSWVKDSVYFLGDPFGHPEYPLLIPFWRAANACMLSSPNNISDRVDGLLMFLITLITIYYWTLQITKSREAGFVAAAIVSSLPLQTWHATAGYAELHIQAFLLLSMWAVFNNRLVLAGLFTAGMIYSKNEGLIIYMPCVLSYVTLRLLLNRETDFHQKFRGLLKYNVTWIVPTAPWLVFKVWNNVGFTIPSEAGLGYMEGSIQMFFKMLLDAPASNLFWIAVIVILIATLRRIIDHKELRLLVFTGLLMMAMFIFIFTSTGAYVFMENQMTIHRSLLQIAPFFVLICISALLTFRENRQLNPIN